MKSFHKLRPLLFFLCCFLLLIGIASSALSEETYVFERMWPTLQQPWYFFHLGGLAIDMDGNVYVANSWNYKIQKFSYNGQFITEWGSQGEFSNPAGIAIDNSGFIYVVDLFLNNVQKFTSDGQFVTKWGSEGSDDGEFNRPTGIAIDKSGYVYVADTENHRIQKFTLEGVFLGKWGSYGSGNGEFDKPTGINIDNNGIVYVVDIENHRIQKFTSEGIFIDKFGSVKSGFDSFETLSGIVINTNGDIFVADRYNHSIKKFSSDVQLISEWGSWGYGKGKFAYPCPIAISLEDDSIFVGDNSFIQKFNFDGQFITQWGSSGSDEGEFIEPTDITVDKNGYVYVADNENHRIQKFTSAGQFISQWGSEGEGDGQFYYPNGIATDSSGNVYVTSRDRIQKFTSSGQFLTKWGSYGSEDGEFFGPHGIATDSNGNVYVSDRQNYRIQKFTSGGQFLTKWGSYGSEDGEFGINGPYGVAVDSNDYVYVVDPNNHRIQKFTPDGQFVMKWGDSGKNLSDGGLFIPDGITIDKDDYVYVTEYYDSCFQKFTSDGQFISIYGSQGIFPGQMIRPDGLTVNTNGDVYLADTINNRIQVFKKVTLEDKSKAIIIAGGGPFSGNNLWNATQMCANFAYRTLAYQGFTKKSIYYLTSDTNLDLDNNGELDDVDGNATNANLQNAITSWASDADNLVLYLVDHGGDTTFRMSGTETLHASELDSWLDQLQETILGKVIVIYDACESGSFLSGLIPPSSKERVIISSTSPDESAYFVTQGSVSFSNYFWTHIFNGLDIKNSFNLAKEALSQTTEYQNPLLDADGDGTGNEEIEDLTLTEGIYIGNGTVIYGEAPVIYSVSDPQTIDGTSSATLCAFNVTDGDGIARVWAVIRPPYYFQGSSDNPVQNLPSIDLMPVGGDQYQATYNSFNIEGVYSIAIYARDRIGNCAVPKLTTVSVTNPLRRKAIIVAGGSQSDEIWPAIENNATFAYNVLTFQGYTDDDIYFMSPNTSSTEWDAAPSLNNLNYAIGIWAQESTHDLVLYMIGNGDNEIFEVNTSEILSASQLDSWLDTLQSNISGKVTIIYAACQSGSFLPLLTPPEGKERILISSSNSSQSSYFLSDGAISFSRFFWTYILNGMNVRDSFINAKNAIYYCAGQTPQMDDNSNGIGNEKEDGIISAYYSIGVGIMLAGDNPIIGSISSEQTLSEILSAFIWVDDVTTTGIIDRVLAVITPPDYDPGFPSDPVTDLPILELSYVGGDKYAGTYTDFPMLGTYKIDVYAIDTDGNISAPMETSILVEEPFPWELFYPSITGH